MLPRIILVTLITVVSSMNLPAADWSQFRGPGGSGLYEGNQSLPLNWSPTENIRWKTKLPGPGSSTPVTLENKIALTYYSGYGLDELDPGDKANLKLHVVSIDRKNGEILWDKQRPASSLERPFKGQVRGHGYATPTPAVDETGIYVYFGVTGLTAYDWDGNEQWTVQTGEKTAGFGTATSPIIYQDLVIVNASIEGKTLYAFNKATGDLVWKVEEVLRSWSTPTIVKTSAGADELIVNRIDTIHGYHPLTGKELWNCAGIDDYIVPVVVGHDHVAFCFGGRSNRAIAVKTGGRGDVTETHKLWEVNVGANVTSPLYYEGRLYCANDKGIALCLDAQNGEIIYRERLPTSARVYASIVSGDGKFFVTTRDAGVLVLAAGPEYKELTTNVLESDTMFNAGPCLDDGEILLRSNNYLWCIGK